jgi:hypothetical protein
MLDKIKRWLGIPTTVHMWCVSCRATTASHMKSIEEISTRRGLRRRAAGRCSVCKHETSSFVAA